MDKIYFTKEMINFYDLLKVNNNKEWFAENRKIYDEKIIPAAKEYIIDMGRMLETIVPDIHYAPKVDGSIFRIHKDVRINKGKPPFYYTGVGIARVTPEILASYRQLVNNKKYNETLINIKKTAQENYFNILGDKLKNVPKGIEPVSDTAAEFLKYKSIYINDEMPINKDFYSPELFSYTFDIFKKLKDFFIFLSQVVDNSKH